MEEKKIATSVDVLINVGQFEHLQITKYAEKKITYNSKEEMIAAEDQLTDELVQDVIRTMRSMPDKLGKKTEAVNRIEDKIQKKIPTWLEEGSVPNIANTAKTNSEKSIANNDNKIESKKKTEESKNKETDAFLNSEKPAETVKAEPKAKSLDEDLFGEDLFNEK